MFETLTLNFGWNKTHKKDKVNNKRKHFICWSTTFKLEIKRVCWFKNSHSCSCFCFFVTGYLSCQIFLMTYVNWPDKELRPVADSISFGTDNVGSNIQWNWKKSVPIWSVLVWPDADIWTCSLSQQWLWSKIKPWGTGNENELECSNGTVGPVFSKLFRLDWTDSLSFGPKFLEFLVKWIAPRESKFWSGLK